jgi:hypothetical protein
LHPTESPTDHPSFVTTNPSSVPVSNSPSIESKDMTAVPTAIHHATPHPSQMMDDSIRDEYSPTDNNNFVKVPKAKRVPTAKREKGVKRDPKVEKRVVRKFRVKRLLVEINKARVEYHYHLLDQCHLLLRRMVPWNHLFEYQLIYLPYRQHHRLFSHSDKYWFANYHYDEPSTSGYYGLAN